MPSIFTFNKPSRHVFALGLCFALGAAPAHAQTVTPPVPLDPPTAPWPGPPEDQDIIIPLILTVRADGSVSAAELPAPRDPTYDAAARTQALTWHFTPALRNGAPIASRIRSEVRFIAPAPS
ncbi:MAG TPA: hypothetical protein VFV94_14965, partial [Polyangiaceae bacterium]|nr:hypothetical protein [Polyangiaceae bacterium]